MTDKPPIRVTIVDDDIQPGDHISSHHPHPRLVNVLRDPYTGRPSSPRRAFLLYVILPVLGTAVILAIVLAANLGIL
jgi:hypothetical protein